MKPVEKKVIIIGATSGMGRALSVRFADAGWLVGITGRRKPLLEQLSAAQPVQYCFRAFDVTDTSAVHMSLDSLVAEMGGLDMLVICAGGGENNDTLSFTLEQHMIELNITGFTCVAGWAFNYFQLHKKGHLAAITSIAGLRGSRQSPGYSAAKSFQINYLEGLRQKAKHLRLSITVTDIRPGFVENPRAVPPVKVWIAPVDKAARQIFHALLRKQNVVYITRRWTVAAWMFKLLPRWIHERL